MKSLVVKLLGPIDVEYGGGSLVRFPTKVTQALLVYLIEQGAVVHLREVLAEFLFPGRLPGSGRRNLRQTIYELRRLIPKVDSHLGAPVPLIESSRDHIELNPIAEISLDSKLMSRALQHHDTKALSEIVGLYRGEFAQDFSLPDNNEFESWLLNRRQFYRTKIQTVLDLLIAKSSRTNAYEQAEEYARRLVDIDPLRESSVRSLMEIYASKGERTKALRLFNRFSTQLSDELHTVPEPETCFLYDRILIGGAVEQDCSHMQVASGNKPAEAPKVQAGSGPTIDLPTPPTAFFGRRKEIEDIRSLLVDADARLVTMLGPGGTGKTRLGIEVASDLAGEFPDGVFFLPLQSVHRVDEFISVALKAFNFPTYQSGETPGEKLLNYLREKRILLVLDNFEHLAGVGGPTMVADLLRQAPGLHLLATTRIRLNIQGEHLYPVAGLEFPPPETVHAHGSPEKIAVDYSAVRLFVDRARQIQPGFQPGLENIQDVIRICDLVNGFPLGIELATTWIELLSPSDIIQEIQKNLDFLEAEIQDLPERQRSFRAVFDYSWQLLEADERDAMRRLSVFKGAFSGTAALAVSKSSFRVLLSLSNKSWLQRVEGDLFGIHNLMQHYAREKLAKQADVEAEALQALSEHYAAFLDEQFTALRSAGQLAALDAIEAELDNIRAAFQCWIAQAQFRLITERVLPALHLFGLVRDYLDEIGELCLAGLGNDFDPGDEKNVDKLLLWIVSAWANARHRSWDVLQHERVEKIWKNVVENQLEEALGPWFYVLTLIYFFPGSDDAIAALENAMDRLEKNTHPWWYAMAVIGLAGMQSTNGGKVERAWIERAIRILDQHGGPYEQASAILMLADYKRLTGDYEGAQELLDCALEKVRNIRAVWFTYQVIEAQAGVFRFQGLHQEAFQCDREVSIYYERAGSKLLLHDSIAFESLHHSRYGSLEKAFQYRRQACTLVDSESLPLDLAWDWLELGELHRLVGDFDQAKDYFLQAYEVFAQFQVDLGLGYYHRSLGYLDFYRGYYRNALEHFLMMRTFTSDHLWSDSLALMCLGRTAVFLGDFGRAAQYLEEGITLAGRIGYEEIKLIGVLGLAELAMQNKDFAKAIRLATLVARDPRTWNEIREDARGVTSFCADELLPDDYQRSIEEGNRLSLEEFHRILL